MKLNNRGITLIELIISFAILALVVFSMLGTVISIRRKAGDEMFNKEMMEFKSILVKDIEDVLIKNEISNVTCEELSCAFQIEDETINTIVINTINKTIAFNDIVYDIPNASQISFGSIDLSITSIDETRSILTIDVPYFETGNSNPNYGFKIVHPFVVETS